MSFKPVTIITKQLVSWLGLQCTDCRLIYTGISREELERTHVHPGHGGLSVGSITGGNGGQVHKRGSGE